MTAYRCDRCNRYFTETEVPIKRARIVAGVYKYNSDGNMRNLDICPNCYMSLEEWMKGGAKSDKEDH